MVRLLLAIILTFGFPLAFAQETEPGDACTAGEIGRYILSGGPELSNTGHLIICDGTTWNKVMTFGSGGTMGSRADGSRASPSSINRASR